MDWEVDLTDVRPACHDGVAIHRITSSDNPESVTVSLGKVVDGKEEVMGVLPFKIDYEHRVLSAAMVGPNGLRGTWTFSWSGMKMRGTLDLQPGRAVVRNIELTKQ